jgi:hypothetical protein
MRILTQKNNPMKKVFYVGLIAFATLSLPSCGGENKAVETTTETSADTATLQEAPVEAVADSTAADSAATSTSVDTTKH